MFIPLYPRFCFPRFLFANLFFFYLRLFFPPLYALIVVSRRFVSRHPRLPGEAQLRQRSVGRPLGGDREGSGYRGWRPHGHVDKEGAPLALFFIDEAAVRSETYLFLIIIFM